MIFEKKKVYNDLFLYDYILKNTVEKKISFGYFIYRESAFYGKTMNNEMKIYCSDIVLCLLNPLIVVKITNNNTSITVKYNILHYLAMLLQIILCLFFTLYIIESNISIFVSVLIIFLNILIYKINFELRFKQIDNCLNLIE